jgi:hypothetical protein
MGKFLNTPLLLRFLQETFSGDRKCFSDRGCRSFHISQETRMRV